jgi:hypothetical protein
VRSGKLISVLLIGGGLAIVLIGGLWLAGSMSEGSLRVSGALLGAGLLMIVVLPLIGGGIYLWVQSGREAESDAEREEMRKILDMVKSRGQLQVSELVIELGASQQKVQEMIHALVGMGVFSGFINWEEGTLYSEDASGLRDLERCKYCGGELDLAGKGVVTCPYCGTEYFLN